ncbi:hypothetical protein DFS34DRAFT_622425 [Phlyctochytrium arcticum]|nr:hypothetical protein DFS34DRAFT_622425 [Phlyctochytrium arcticum]
MEMEVSSEPLAGSDNGSRPKEQPPLGEPDNQKTSHEREHQEDDSSENPTLSNSNSQKCIRIHVTLDKENPQANIFDYAELVAKHNNTHSTDPRSQAPNGTSSSHTNHTHSHSQSDSESGDDKEKDHQTSGTAGSSSGRRKKTEEGYDLDDDFIDDEDLFYSEMGVVPPPNWNFGFFAWKGPVENFYEEYKTDLFDRETPAKVKQKGRKKAATAEKKAAAAAAALAAAASASGTAATPAPVVKKRGGRKSAAAQALALEAASGAKANSPAATKTADAPLSPPKSVVDNAPVPTSLSSLAAVESAPASTPIQTTKQKKSTPSNPAQTPTQSSTTKKPKAKPKPKATPTPKSTATSQPPPTPTPATSSSSSSAKDPMVKDTSNNHLGYLLDSDLSEDDVPLATLAATKKRSSPDASDPSLGGSSSSMNGPKKEEGAVAPEPVKKKVKRKQKSIGGDASTSTKGASKSASNGTKVDAKGKGSAKSTVAPAVETPPHLTIPQDPPQEAGPSSAGGLTTAVTSPRPFPSKVERLFHLLEEQAKSTQVGPPSPLSPSLQKILTECALHASLNACLNASFFTRVNALLPYPDSYLRKIIGMYVIPRKLEKIQPGITSLYEKLRLGVAGCIQDGKFTWTDEVRVIFWNILCGEWEMAELDNEYHILTDAPPEYNESAVRKAVYGKVMQYWPEGTMTVEGLSRTYSTMKRRVEKRVGSLTGARADPFRVGKRKVSSGVAPGGSTASPKGSKSGELPPPTTPVQPQQPPPLASPQQHPPPPLLQQPPQYHQQQTQQHEYQQQQNVYTPTSPYNF